MQQWLPQRLLLGVFQLRTSFVIDRFSHSRSTRPRVDACSTQWRILLLPFSIHWPPSSDWIDRFPEDVVVPRPVFSREDQVRHDGGDSIRSLDALERVSVRFRCPWQLWRLLLSWVALLENADNGRNWKTNESSHLLDRFEFEAEKENDRGTNNRECLDFKRTKTPAALVYSRSDDGSLVRWFFFSSSRTMILLFQSTDTATRRFFERRKEFFSRANLE